MSKIKNWFSGHDTRAKSGWPDSTWQRSEADREPGSAARRSDGDTTRYYPAPIPVGEEQGRIRYM